MFTDEEIVAMGLYYILAMHEPIKDSDGGFALLCADPGDVDLSYITTMQTLTKTICADLGNCRWLSARYGNPDGRGVRGGGYVFAVSQVNLNA